VEDGGAANATTGSSREMRGTFPGDGMFVAYRCFAYIYIYYSDNRSGYCTFYWGPRVVTFTRARCLYHTIFCIWLVNLFIIKEFLFYYEKYSPPADASNIGFDRSFLLSTKRSIYRNSVDRDLLVKQTYSVLVKTDKGQRKWHLSKSPSYFLLWLSPIHALDAYYTRATFTSNHLGTIDNIHLVWDVVVTEGMFRVKSPRSPRVGKHARADDKIWSNVCRVGNRTYPAFSSPYQQDGRPDTPGTNPVLMHEPYQWSDRPGCFRDQVESSVPYSQRIPSVSPTSYVRVNHANLHGDSQYSPECHPSHTKT